jgi:hypothetical protein
MAAVNRRARTVRGRVVDQQATVVPIVPITRQAGVVDGRNGPTIQKVGLPHLMTTTTTTIHEARGHNNNNTPTMTQGGPDHSTLTRNHHRDRGDQGLHIRKDRDQTAPTTTTTTTTEGQDPPSRRMRADQDHRLTRLTIRDDHVPSTPVTPEVDPHILVMNDPTTREALRQRGRRMARSVPNLNTRTTPPPREEVVIDLPHAPTTTMVPEAAAAVDDQDPQHVTAKVVVVELEIMGTGTVRICVIRRHNTPRSLGHGGRSPRTRMMMAMDLIIRVMLVLNNPAAVKDRLRADLVHTLRMLRVG